MSNFNDPLIDALYTNIRVTLEAKRELMEIASALSILYGNGPAVARPERVANAIIDSAKAVERAHADELALRVSRTS